MSSIASETAALAAALSCLAALACGGSDKAAPQEPPGAAAAPADEAAPGTQPGAGDGMKVAGTRGTLQAAQIQAGLAPHTAALEDCYKGALQRKKFLSGKLLLEVRVAKTGQVGGAALVESDIGDWEVERCVLGVARKLGFAKPTGGDGTAVFKVPLDFTSDQQVLETWPEEQIAAVVTEKRATLDACAGVAGEAPSDVAVTLYVGNRGKVEAVGFASDKEPPIPDAWADCAAHSVAAWTFTDPQGKIVKAGFRYPPQGTEKQ
jgi:hypothetical protein